MASDTRADEKDSQNREPVDDSFLDDTHSSVSLPSVLQNVVPPHRHDQVDRFLSIALVLVFVIALCITILVIALPKENERFTDFFILSENRTAEDYPYDIIAGQHYPMFIGVGNHEGRDMTYILEIWHVKTEFDPATNTTQILTMEPQERFLLSLIDNETSLIPYTMSVKKTDFNRVAFLLFTETTSDTILTGSNRINESYRDLYLRVSVWQGFSQESNSNVP